MLTFFNIGKYFISLMLLFVWLSAYSFLSRSLPAENQTIGRGDRSSLMSLIFHLVVLEFSQQVWKLLANINLCPYFNNMAVSGKRQEHRLWELLALEPDCHTFFSSEATLLEENLLPVGSISMLCAIWTVLLTSTFPDANIHLVGNKLSSAAEFQFAMPSVKHLGLLLTPSSGYIQRKEVSSFASRSHFCSVMPDFPIFFQSRGRKERLLITHRLSLIREDLNPNRNILFNCIQGSKVTAMYMLIYCRTKTYQSITTKVQAPPPQFSSGISEAKLLKFGIIHKNLGEEWGDEKMKQETQKDKV